MTETQMRVFLDLWGVLLDSVKMNEEYNNHAARILASLLGGEESKWREAYDSAWESYLLEIAEAEEKSEDWLKVADRLDVTLILDTLEAVGVDWRPPDVLMFARDLENEVASSVAVAYPEVRGVMESLHEAGHMVYVATQAGEWNARGALEGVRLLDLVDGIFSGSSQKAFKVNSAYWRDILATLKAASREMILVDDRLDYLKAAASAGFTAILLDRNVKEPRKKTPKFVSVVASDLTNLPSLVDSLSQRRMRTRTWK